MRLQRQQSQFADRPLHREWESRLRDGMRRGREAGCTADLLVTSNHAGFGSKVNNIVNTLWVAVYLNSSVSWHLPDNLAKQWFQYFDNRLGIAVPECPPIDQDMAHGLAHELRWWTRALTKVDHQYMVNLKRHIVNHLWTLKEGVLSDINARLTDAGLQPGMEYIGLHIRRGDKAMEAEPLPVSQYADTVKEGNEAEQPQMSQIAPDAAPKAGRPSPAQQLEMTRVPSKLGGSSGLEALTVRIQEAARDTNVKTVYLASDDWSSFDDLRHKLGDEFTILRAPAARRQVCSGGRNCHYDDDDVFMSLLTDITALQRSSTFVGTASSNIGRLIFFLRPRDQPSISLDDHADFMKRPG